MQINRLFTKPGASPYEGIPFAVRSSLLTKRDGRVVFSQDGVVAPESWDQTSVDVLAQKYFRRRGCNQGYENSIYNSRYSHLIDMEGPGSADRSMGDSESDLRQTIHRIVGAWTAWGERLGYFATSDSSQAFYDEMSYMLATQMFAPNSPQWFNTGLSWAYGITGQPQGHFFVDYEGAAPGAKLTAKKSTDAYTHPQTGACFIQSIDDDLVGPNGIMDLWTREARVFKYGGGSGTNFSTIRAKDEPLSGGGVSSGLLSFLRVGDRAAGAIKSGGTSRRAAKLVCLDMDHPDILEFIDWKVKEERKVAMLVAGNRAMHKAWTSLLEASRDGGADPKSNAKFAAALREARHAGVPDGFLVESMARLQQGVTEITLQTVDTDWEGDGYDTVSAQNANNSVRVPDTFMGALLSGSSWNLTRRVDGRPAAFAEAAYLWRKVAEAAWACADPGVQFDTTFNFWHTCPEDGRINATNPCSEYAFLDDTACNLGSLNLVKFLNLDGVFDTEAYIHACELMTIALDITVSMSQYPSKVLAENSYRYRTLGGGYANLGGLLMRLGLPYDSPEGRRVAAGLTAVMTGAAYRTSGILAKELGAFPAYNKNKDAMLRVLSNHCTLAHSKTTLIGYHDSRVEYQPLDSSSVVTCSGELALAPIARNLWDEVITLLEKHGMRNAQVTVLAPTGTIGILMGCDTTGVEPDFALVKFKKLAGGGYMKLVNQGVPQALRALGYTQSKIEDILDHVSGEAIMKGHTDGVTRDQLVQAGYGLETLKEWDAKLTEAFDPRMVLPVDELVEKFGQTRVDAFLLDVGGRGTVEGAPHLKVDHLPVFDCASTCGRFGTRVISPEGHLLMMAAVQPFLSGAISKTVNLPGDTTIQEVGDIYLRAWTLGLKAVALYRDGSKLSQPLATSMELLEVAEALALPEAQADKVTSVAKALTHIATRKKLPNKRHGSTTAVDIGGNKFYLRTGEYADGRLGEIFLDSYKEGTGYKAILNAFAIAISIGLQHGVPLEEFVDAFLFTKFEPNGMVRDHDTIKICMSILDFVFRELAITYLGRYELANVRPEDFISESHGTPTRSPAPVDTVTEAALSAAMASAPGAPAPRKRTERDESREKGYTGDPCPQCGHLTLVRNGVCMKCLTCGSTTGCS